MWPLSMLIAGFVIFWALEIRFNEVTDRVTTLEIIIKELENHLADLRRELPTKEKGV